METERPAVPVLSRILAQLQRGDIQVPSAPAVVTELRLLVGRSDSKIESIVALLERDQALVDRCLAVACAAWRLADGDPNGIASREGKDLRRHQAVVKNDVGTLQRLQALQGQQAGIAGARAHEPSHAGRCGGRFRRFGVSESFGDQPFRGALAAPGDETVKLRRLSLAALSRPLEPKESAALRRLVKANVAAAPAPKRPEAYAEALQDALWAMLNSGEFATVP